MKTQTDKRIDGLNPVKRHIFFSPKPPEEGYADGDVWCQTAEYSELFDRIVAASQYDSENHEWALKGAFVSTSYIDTYSTSEVKTNKIWIDGKPIYRLVFTATIPAGIFSAGMPGYDVVSVSGLISGNVGDVISVEGFYYHYSSGIYGDIKADRFSMRPYNISYNFPGTDIFYERSVYGYFNMVGKQLVIYNTDTEANGKTLTVILEYTKTEE